MPAIETAPVRLPSRAIDSSFARSAPTNRSPGPLVAMNTIIAESIDYCATKLEEATEGDPEALNSAMQELLTEIINECSAIIFNGDGYSEEWHVEAAEARTAEPEDHRRCACHPGVARGRWNCSRSTVCFPNANWKADWKPTWSNTA